MEDVFLGPFPTKICSRCKEPKSLFGGFFRAKKEPCGFQSACKGCHREENDRYKENSGGRERINLNQKRRRLENPAQARGYTQKYKQWLTPKRKAAQNKYQSARRLLDPDFKLRGNLRNRIVKALQGKAKSKTTESLLGCSFDFLKQWLEGQFENGMNWTNYSLRGWHVDHKIPCAKFDLVDPEQQAACFHFTNLQPLWAKDNLVKNYKF